MHVLVIHQARSSVIFLVMQLFKIKFLYFEGQIFTIVLNINIIKLYCIGVSNGQTVRPLAAIPQGKKSINIIIKEKLLV